MAAAAGSGTELLGVPMGVASATPLAPEEVARRLQRTRRELSNRRKILLRNLPAESSSQEIHDLLKDFELKYCYVDKNKRTAFVTLLNGEQAQHAIQLFHQRSLRGKEISVQFQPTDALLCITNIPTSYTLPKFEELLQPYGNIERHFLIYSEFTGCSKGYGFVEYMKKDSAAKARLDLLGKQLDGNVLFAQWMDVNQLSPDHVHSRCLCVDDLPTDYADAEDIMKTFSSKYKPVFCQMRNNRKGLLPEPNAAQIMKSFNTPAMLQMILQPQLRGCAHKPAVLGAPMHLPHLVSPSLSPAFLHLNKVHQGPVVGNASSLLLQNLPHLQLVQQQLAKAENVQANSKPGLLGEPPAVLLQTMVGMGTAPPVSPDVGSHGEAHHLSNRTPAQMPVAAGIGMLPFFPNQHIIEQTMPRQNSAQENPSPSGGLAERSQSYQQSLTNLPAGQWAGYLKQQSQLKSTDSSLGISSKKQTSLLGDPPKEIHLSTNPYLNLASVLPSVCLSAIASKTNSNKQHSGLPNTLIETSAAQETPSQQAVENYFNYSPQYGDYTQEAVQQWYQQYAQVYQAAQTRAGELETEGSGESEIGVYGDVSTYLQVMPSYYAQGSFHPGLLPFAPQNPLKVAPVRNEKRSSSCLSSSPEDGPVEYVSQHAQGSGVHYAELYLKRKRVY
ncbi:ribonucleoprotein PTB-binding 2 isoform X3 [Sphaerodactylus townsendi]|uniref:ribonucleoprotein PTB-binding 2 isoform X3 n=1 Tax=Sphaerodactylus townsendi TaxID=933632 RepID=UPI0020261656|nr:ribonucleoprotein PTB-binding 2 isoform X3 [Sphaerodactylus townsendi]